MKNRPDTQPADQRWMQHAIEMAKQAAAAGEVPVGAIIVAQEKIISQGFNQPISQLDPSAHAEIVAIRDAAQTRQNYRLVDSTLYVTLEPCPMCAGAIIQARITRVVYGAADQKSGAAGSIVNLFAYPWNHKVAYTGNILAQPCAQLLQQFFQAKR